MSNDVMRRVAYYQAMGPGYWYSKVRDLLSIDSRRMSSWLKHFSGYGLEVGGKSAIFGVRGLIPIYRTCAWLDNVTYSDLTAWEGHVQAGETFQFHSERAPGHQYVMEGASLESLPSAKYDFVASSHMLEHSANPLAVLCGWKRLLKEGGRLLLVLPHRDGTFDHRRRVTELRHLVQDYENQTDESDRTHLEEILQLHDLRRDAAQASRADFERWISNNPVTRGAHHHVFDMRLAVQVVDFSGYQLVEVEAIRPYHIVIIASKVSKGTATDNSSFLPGNSDRYRRSPFKTDRKAGNIGTH
jgi:SAM-dependent methyltransferase